jgi:hypothetical protein
VVVVAELPPKEEPGFYPDPLFVRTTFPRELSWLLIELRDIFADWIYFGNKFFFYGRLGEAAILYGDQAGIEEDLSALLLSVIDEADRLAVILLAAEEPNCNQ